MKGEICILVSFLKEIKPFIDLLSDLNTERDGNIFRYIGTIGEKRVQVVIAPVGEGKVSGSLIKGSSYVISSGICGALVPYLCTGDVVFSTKVYSYREAVSASVANEMKNKRLHYLKIPAGRQVYEKLETEVNTILNTELIAGLNAKLKTGLNTELKNEHFSINTGPTVTSGFTLQDTDSKSIVGRMTSALSVDMEDFYRLSAARKYGVPFISVRAVFDELQDEILPWKGGIHPSFRKKLNVAVSSLTVVLQSILVSEIP